MQEVGPSVFVSLIILSVSFLPLLFSRGHGRPSFRPLALTKTYAMLSGACVAVILVPALSIFIAEAQPSQGQWFCGSPQWRIGKTLFTRGEAVCSETVGTHCDGLPWHGLDSCRLRVASTLNYASIERGKHSLCRLRRLGSRPLLRPVCFRTWMWPLKKSLKCTVCLEKWAVPTRPQILHHWEWPKPH